MKQSKTMKAKICLMREMSGALPVPGSFNFVRWWGEHLLAAAIVNTFLPEGEELNMRGGTVERIKPFSLI